MLQTHRCLKSPCNNFPKNLSIASYVNLNNFNNISKFGTPVQMWGVQSHTQLTPKYAMHHVIGGPLQILKKFFLEEEIEKKRNNKKK